MCRIQHHRLFYCHICCWVFICVVARKQCRHHKKERDRQREMKDEPTEIIEKSKRQQTVNLFFFNLEAMITILSVQWSTFFGQQSNFFFGFLSMRSLFLVFAKIKIKHSSSDSKCELCEQEKKREDGDNRLRPAVISFLWIYRHTFLSFQSRCCVEFNLSLIMCVYFVSAINSRLLHFWTFFWQFFFLLLHFTHRHFRFIMYTQMLLDLYYYYFRNKFSSCACLYLSLSVRRVLLLALLLPFLFRSVCSLCAMTSCTSFSFVFVYCFLHQQQQSERRSVLCK